MAGLFGNAIEIDKVLIAFPKIGKNTRGRLDLLTSIILTHEEEIQETAVTDAAETATITTAVSVTHALVHLGLHVVDPLGKGDNTYQRQQAKRYQLVHGCSFLGVKE